MQRKPPTPPRESTLTVPDPATQREVLALWAQLDRLPQSQDEQSALVEREWTRIVGLPSPKRSPGFAQAGRRRGQLAERPMIGEHVTATFPASPGDLFGGLRRVSGTVTRNGAGELVIRSADGGETPVPRDASVDRSRGR